MRNVSITDRLAAAVTPYDRMWLGGLIALEFILVGLYFGATTAEPASIRHILYPLLWINIAVWVFVKVRPGAAGRGIKVAGGAIAAGYFAVLSIIAGLLSLNLQTPNQMVVDTGFTVVMASPGWGPIVGYITPQIQVVLVPYLVIGYVALAYLVYVTVLDVSKSLLSGVIGLLSCVSCTAPVFASLIAGFAGGSTALTSAIYSLSIDLSTVAFVFAVALLYYRPGFGK